MRTATIEKCEQTWRSDQPTLSEDAYRQHRCGRPEEHRGGCVCQYCGARRWNW